MLKTTVSDHLELLFWNVEITLETCDIEFILGGMPISKHIYHTLHSLDQWFINPNEYTEPDFHVDGLNSLFKISEKILNREELLQYFETIKVKLRTYVTNLNDTDLDHPPINCKYTRFSLILGQLRHLYSHIGLINATTILRTGRWPKVVGLTGMSTKELYE